MPYLNLDDGFHEDPELADLNLEELGLWMCGLSYCNRHLTDGFIPDKVLSKFGATRSQLRVARALTTKSVWSKCPGGYQVANYSRWCSTRQEVEQKRSNKAVAGQLGGAKSAESRKSVQAPASTQTKHLLEDNPSTCLPRARSPLLSNPIQSNDPPQTPQGGQDGFGSEDVADPEPIPDEPKPDSKTRYRQAYESGIKAGKGEPYALPREQEGHLAQVILAFALDSDTREPLRGDVLLRWIRDHAEWFARWLKSEPDDIARYYSAYGPKGLLKRLNEVRRAS